MGQSIVTRIGEDLAVCRFVTFQVEREDPLGDRMEGDEALLAGLLPRLSNVPPARAVRLDLRHLERPQVGVSQPREDRKEEHAAAQLRGLVPDGEGQKTLYFMLLQEPRAILRRLVSHTLEGVEADHTAGNGSLNQPAEPVEVSVCRGRSVAPSLQVKAIRLEEVRRECRDRNIHLSPASDKVSQPTVRTAVFFIGAGAP